MTANDASFLKNYLNFYITVNKELKDKANLRSGRLDLH
jgi:hypothetical protein